MNLYEPHVLTFAMHAQGHVRPMHPPVVRTGLAIIVLLLSIATAHAATLSNLRWVESDRPVFAVDAEDNPIYDAEILDDGHRLRISFPDSQLSGDIRDIGERGIVRGVFPYEIGDPGRANFDILLKAPGKLEVSVIGGGLEVAILAADAGPGAPDAESATPPPTAEAAPETPAPDAPAATGRDAASLRAVTPSRLPGERVQVYFSVEGTMPAPGVFRTVQPPRVVVDLFDTASAVAERSQRVRAGALDGIVVAEADDRTRVVLNLQAPVDFEQRVQDDGLVLVLSPPSPPPVRPAARQPAFSDPEEGGLAFGLEALDFRRTPEGAGEVTVRLSSPDVGVDVHESAGEIIVDFPATRVPRELEQSLDVVDFATPVHVIDTFFTGQGARMIVSPVGEYSYSSYQVGEVLTIQVDPRREREDEREPDEFGYTGERLSLNFQKISVNAVLQVLADFTNLNFVTSDNVSGELTLHLKDVPWDQALDVILRVMGLDKRIEGNVVWVAPADEIATRERLALEARQKAAELEPLVSELIPVNYAKASEIAEILKSVRAVDTGYDTSPLGNVTVSEIETESNTLLSPRGNVTVDERTNTLLVQDTAAKIAEIRKLISQLDQPVRQVLIETRIVEANDDFSRNIGVRLGFTRIDSTDADLGTLIGSGSLEDNNAVSGDDGVLGRTGYGVDLPSGTPTGAPEGTSAASYAFTLAKAGAGYSHLIDLEISALEAEGAGKVIANPRLLTADQNEARIEQGQERVFTTSFLGQGGVVTKKAVLSLTVTPQITPDDRLILDVFVTKDSFLSPTNPTIDTKQIETKVLLDNGETVVIGGIYEHDQSQQVVKVPLLGDIPGLGALFRRKSQVDSRTEFLIFLTPRILNNALTASWNNRPS